MKKIFNKIKKMIRFIGVLFYLLYYRIKNIGTKKGIAQVVESFKSGGLEQVAANIYKAFKDNGDISTVICISNTTGPMFEQIYTPKDIRIVYYDVIEMIKFCAKNNIGTLIFHFTTFHMILFRFLGFKNYYIIHNTYIWYTNEEWKKLKIKLKFSNGIIAVSEWCKDYFIKKTGYKNVKLILNIESVTGEKRKFQREVKLVKYTSNDRNDDKYKNKSLKFLSNDEIVKKLLKDGYINTENKVYEKKIDKDNTLLRIKYDLDHETIEILHVHNSYTEKIVVDYQLKIFRTVVFKNNNIDNISEKYVFDLKNEKNICEIGECATLKNTRKMVEKYLSQLQVG